MIKYPNGMTYTPKEKKERGHKKSKTELSLSSANRGMDLEGEINKSNEYYTINKIALITKRPTPINIVKVDYSRGARITDAYFEKQSTTDYNGIYREKYIDFEAKNTKSKTCFPLANIHKHQIDHLKNVIAFGGIAFFIIAFEAHNEFYLIKASDIIEYYEHGTRKSIPYGDFAKIGYKIKQGYSPRLLYVDAIDEAFFK